jgi:hypothetical protein
MKRMKRIFTLWISLFFVVTMQAYAAYPLTAKDVTDGNVFEETDFDNLAAQVVNEVADPDNINDLSNDNTEFRITKDPYAAGSEVRPVTATEEFQELRYQILQLMPGITYWYQDFSPVGYGYANLAPNGGFELWSDGITSAPDRWSLEGGTVVSRDTGDDNGYQDRWAIEITSAGVTSNGISYTFDELEASKTYYVICRAKVTAGDTFKIHTDGASSELSATTDSQTWSTVLGTFVTDSTPTDVKITLGSDTSGDVVYADSLMVVKGSLPSAYARHIPSVPITHNTFKNLVVQNTGIETITIAADYLVVENPSTNHRLLLQNISETNDITSLGLGGIDIGAEDDITYYQYVAFNPTTADTNSFMSSSLTAPSLPSGYTYYKVVGFCRNNTDIIEFYQDGNRLFYAAPEDDTSVLAAGTSGSFADVDCTDYTGATGICKSVLLEWYSATAGGGSVTFYIRPNGSTATNGRQIGIVRVNEAEEASGEFMMYLDADQKFEYKGGATGLTVMVSACILNL